MIHSTRSFSTIARGTLFALGALLVVATAPARASDDGGSSYGSLLGSQHGSHVWFQYCQGKADSAVLPPDPRTRIVPGIDDGKAVLFNTYWANCHAQPDLVGERAQPTTCGEIRAEVHRGSIVMLGNGAVGAGTFFGKDGPGGDFVIAARDYNNLWRLWGLTKRPDNFDELLGERYGAVFATARNPYPLPGEDPNLTSGGSGQLPASMTQTHNADGSWTGRIGLTCNGCHTAKVGTPADGPGLGVTYGSGSSAVDVGLVGRDFGLASRTPLAVFSLFGTSRGTNNASDVNAFFLLAQDNPARLDRDTLGVLTSGSTASGDTPAWWNMGHRPVKFQDGFFSNDDSRVDIVFYAPIGAGDPAWVRQHTQDVDRWAMSLRSPAYPLPIDETLANKGSVLFHTKDLWAPELNNPVPRPEGGNGSCASCHGAYAPRYSHDPGFLADPSMEGVAAYVTPKAIIGTDPARVDTNNDSVSRYGATSFLSYSEITGTPYDCGPRNRPSVRGDREPGYLAQPLYGVWATAPYLHNGSVPDLWSLLKSSDRPTFWRRVSAPARADQAGKVVMGFDTNLQRAYDPVKVGWRHDVLECGMGTFPFIDCNPSNDRDPLLQMVQKLVYGHLMVAWNVGNLPIWTQWSRQQIENRKIYNTRLFSQGNEGHQFSDVLTDDERKAVIEYLKTL